MKFEVKTKEAAPLVRKQVTTHLFNEVADKFERILKVSKGINQADLARQMIEFAIAHAEIPADGGPSPSIPKLTDPFAKPTGSSHA